MNGDFVQILSLIFLCKKCFPQSEERSAKLKKLKTQENHSPDQWVSCPIGRSTV